ncbi:hypothetical protein MKX33_20685 [Paenibacillus sp. FSL R5-0490]
MQLGRGPTELEANPLPKLASLVTVKPVQISASHTATYALIPEGEIIAWGSNQNGLLGNGGLDGGIPSPVLMSRNQKLSDIVSVDGGEGHGTALRRDGTIWSWGGNYHGQVGNGKTSTNEQYATQVKGPGGVGYLTNITSVSAGLNHTVAIASNGTLWAWGNNGYGQLGVNTPSNIGSYYPVHMGTSFNEVKAVSAGRDFTVALKSDGTVWSWGQNIIGQLGDGTKLKRIGPVQVKGPGGQGFLDQIVAIKSGISHTLALRADGTVWSWGENTNGQLGIGSLTRSNIPVQVQFKDEPGQSIKIQSIDAGGTHNIALSTDKKLFTWGTNFNGGLGVGDTVNRTSPVQVDWQDSIKVSKPVYTTSYVYDANGRLLRKTTSRHDGTASSTYQYTYDRNGNLKHTKVTHP